MDKLTNRKLATPDERGFWKLRVWRSRARGKRAGRLLVKCGDCDRSLEIFFDPATDGVEINGVHASKAEWRRLFAEVLAESGKRSKASATLLALRRSQPNRRGTS